MREVCRRVHVRVVDDAQLSAEAGDESLLGHLLLVANRVAADAGLENYRVVINNGAGSGQTVFHLHLHLIGDRPLNWPPG